MIIVAFLVIFQIISLAAIIVTCIVIRLLLKKINIYEDWILDFKTDVTDTLTKMQAIDKSVVFSNKLSERGAFESDDQVGGVFKDLLELVEKLNKRTQ